MIEIRLGEDSFEQDIRPLVRAFFPREEIKVEIGGEWTETAQYRLEIAHDEQQIRICFAAGDAPALRRDYRLKTAEPDRRIYKNILKKQLYSVLTEYTGRILPWGTLTGIRPTKLAYEVLERGGEAQEIRDFMKEQYQCGEEKTELAIQIAQKELTLLRQMGYQNGYSIYIGIPFCPTTCLYCSFASYPVSSYGSYMEDYLTALCKEMDYAVDAIPDKKLTTLYIGGGTPTALSAELLERLLLEVRRHFPMESVREFTVEAGRPDSITREKLQILKRYGVTRISINPQTMVDRTLELIGRRHTAAAVEEAFYMAREEGHDNINMDLIIGLPGECAEDVAYTLERIRKLNPDSLTVHALAIKRAARLKLKLDELDGLLPRDALRMQQLTTEYAAAEGYEPYYLYRQKNITDNLENIGYARPGKEGLYNILIMEEKQTILALGAAGSSKLMYPAENRIERVENVKYVVDYIKRIDEMIERKRTKIGVCRLQD